MAEKINTEFEAPFLLPKYSKNMFTSIVGSKYAKKFHEVYYADFSTRDKLMKDLYEEAKNDVNLKEKQKIIIKKCYMAYLFAVGSNCGISLPIISYLEKTKPNLNKILNSDIRLKRMMNDLDETISKTGFDLNIYALPQLLTVFFVQFQQKPKEDLYDSDGIYEFKILAVLNKYSRVFSVDSVVNLWYTIIFMKNIVSLAYIKEEEYNENEHIKKQVPSILRTLLIVSKYGIEKEEPPSTSE